MKSATDYYIITLHGLLPAHTRCLNPSLCSDALFPTYEGAMRAPFLTCALQGSYPGTAYAAHLVPDRMHMRNSTILLRNNSIFSAQALSSNKFKCAQAHTNGTYIKRAETKDNFMVPSITCYNYSTTQVVFISISSVVTARDATDAR